MKLCDEVKEIVARLGIPIKPSAVITDSEFAVSWMEYLEKGRRAAKSVSGFPGHLLDEVYSVHPTSCPGRSSPPKESVCIRLWTTGSSPSALHSRVCSSTWQVENNGRQNNDKDGVMAYLVLNIEQD